MNTPARTMLRSQQFLMKNSMTPMPHPPCSPKLASNDFFFVSLDEKVLKGKRFAIMKEVKQKPAEILKGIKIKEFKNCFEQSKKRL